MFLLRLEAPFAVFRTFSAGSFRPTAGFITPSAAYGLLLNIAGVEMRRDDGKSVMTLIRDKDLPKARIALAALEPPTTHSLFQQLHNYPVGGSGKEHKAATKGGKYNIVPVRRSFLAGIKAYIALRDNDELETRLRDGLLGGGPRRYGLPFLGDNNFLIDRLEAVNEPQKAYWYERRDESEPNHDGELTRLTIRIDRADMSNTVSALFGPARRASREIPDAAWVEVGC